MVSGNTIGRMSMARMRMRVDVVCGEVVLTLGHCDSRMQCTMLAARHLVLNLWVTKHQQWL